MTQEQKVKWEKALMQLLGQTVRAEAKLAAQEYFHTALGGEDRGPCGFAWVEITPHYKGNTKEGRAEREIFAALGLARASNGKTFTMWDLGRGLPVQSYDVHAAAARRAAALLREKGFNARSVAVLD